MLCLRVLVDSFQFLPGLQNILTLHNINETLFCFQTDDEYAAASTTGGVSIQLVGKDKDSEWFVLDDQHFDNLYMQGSVDEFNITTADVGKLMLVRLGEDVCNWKNITYQCHHYFHITSATSVEII